MCQNYQIFVGIILLAPSLYALRAPNVPTIHSASSYAIEDWSSSPDSIGRLHVVFKNESIEDVYVSIYRRNLPPREKNVVKIGEWRNFYPQQMTSQERPLYINLTGSSAGELHYKLVLQGKPRLGATHACRAYGSLDLSQGDEIVQSIDASSLGSGIVFTYTEYYDLQMGSLKEHNRGRLLAKNSRGGHCTKGSCRKKDKRSKKKWMCSV